jgi:hypothetical protein
MSPLLFVRDTPCVKIIRDDKGRQSGAPSCCFTHWFANSVCDRMYAPCVEQGRSFLFEQSFVDRHEAEKCLSPCVVPEVAL